MTGAAQTVEQPHGREERIVRSQPTVSEEQMPAHLAGKRRTLTPHGLTHAHVPGRSHHRPATEPRDLLEEHPARLDITHDAGPGRIPQHLAGEQQQHLVGPDYRTRLIHHAQAIAVTVECNTEIRPFGTHRRAQLPQVRCDRWIGMMCREASVNLGVEQDMAPGQCLR